MRWEQFTEKARSALAREILAGRFGSGQRIRTRRDGEALVF